MATANSPSPGSSMEPRQDEAFYRDLFEGAPHAYLVSDGAILVTVNHAAEMLLGSLRESLIGRSLAEMVPYESRRLFLTRVEALSSGRANRIQDWQLSLVHPDGRLVEAELTVERFVAANSTLLRWLLRDVTERHRAEDAMRLSTARYRALVESAVDGIVTIDASGIIESVNAAAERIFGYPSGSLVGSNVEKLMPEPFASEHGGFLGQYLESGERRRLGVGREVVGQRLDGSLFPVDLAVSEIRLGERLFFVGTLRDLTQRHENERHFQQLEEQIRQVQKMEAVGRLAGGVAHDFNTLLGSILGYTEMLLDELEESEPLHRVSRQIHRAAERGAALTRQLLAFGRRQLLQPKVLDLSQVVAELEDLFLRLIPANVKLVRDPAPEVLPVRVDASQIEQVLINLVVNAVDAMPRGGKIEVLTRKGPPPASVEGGGIPVSTVQLIVRDTGHGMDEQTASRIFEPFFTTKEPGRGTGLGLATVYGIVTQSGGVIGVETEVGGGTSFTISLPWAGELDPVPAKPAQPPAQPAPPGDEIVLLVEDDAMFRELLAEVLETRGYLVWQAADPAQAMELCAAAGNQRPALLVTDMIMPGGMTGADLAAELRRLYPQLRVLRMSGYTDDLLAHRGDEDFDSTFLHKPFSTREFAGKVRELLDQARAPSG